MNQKLRPYMPKRPATQLQSPQKKETPTEKFNQLVAKKDRLSQNPQAKPEDFEALRKDFEAIGPAYPLAWYEVGVLYHEKAQSLSACLEMFEKALNSPKLSQDCKKAIEQKLRKFIQEFPSDGRVKYLFALAVSIAKLKLEYFYQAYELGFYEAKEAFQKTFANFSDPQSWYEKADKIIKNIDTASLRACELILFLVKKRYESEKLADQQNIISILYLKLIKAEAAQIALLLEAIDWFDQCPPADDSFINDFQRHIANKDTHDKNHLQRKLGSYFQKKGNNQAALHWYTQARATFSEDSESIAKLIELHEACGQAQVALELRESFKGSEDVVTEFDEAQKLEGEFASQNNYLALFLAIKHYKKAALCKSADAINKLKELSQNPIVGGAASKASLRVYDSKGIRAKSAKEMRSPFHYTDKGLEQLRDDTKAWYETAATENRLYAAGNLGKLLTRNTLFAKNLYRARFLLKKASEASDARVYLQYAKMCYEGEGGSRDVKEAAKYLLMLIETSAEANYLLGQIYYLDEPVTPDESEKITLACRYYRTAAFMGYVPAVLSLLILHERGYLEATYALAQLYENEIQKGPPFPDSFLSNISAPYLPENKIQVHLYFYRILLEKKFDLGKDTARVRQRVEESEEKNVISPGYKEKFDAEDYSIIFSEACEKLEKEQDSRPLRKLAEEKIERSQQKEYAEIIKQLEEYYLKKPNATLYLISSLCYEAKRHSWDSPCCRVLRDVLSAIDSQYASWSQERFNAFLIEKEQQAADFFQEYPSEDSDEEEDKRYESAKEHNRPHDDRVDELLKNLKLKETLKLINEIFHAAPEIEEERYNKFFDRVKSLFLPQLPSPIPAPEASVLQDLTTLNHFAAQGRLSEALPLIVSQFVIAQTRGIHWKRTLWSKPMRYLHRKEVKDGKWLGRSLYSAAVYKEAGIRDFNESTELAKQKLKMAAQLIHNRLRQLHELPPYAPEELPRQFQDRLCTYKFDNRNDQLHHLYTNNYDLFHQLLQWAASQEQPIFLNAENPYVSTGDLPLHALKYSFGIKPYAGHERERLEPCWSKEGKALRPAVGSTFLTLHPLEDYATSDHNHVTSMNIQGRIVIHELIIPERETSFYSAIRERTKFIHVARYPSFDKYRPIYKNQYGLTEELFTAFRHLILNSLPHSNKRKLAYILLGEYLAAYQNLYFMRKAQELARVQGATLLYRDLYGGFSLQPPEDVSACPHGGGDAQRRRREFTAYLRAERKRTLQDTGETDAGPSAKRVELS